MLHIIKKTLINFFLFSPLFLISDTKDISIVIHGGAGWFASMTEEEIEGIEEALNIAADSGYAELMLEGGTSLDAVERAIIIFEDNPLFNAGRGSVYTSELRQEMDASIMDGSNLNAGAVASMITNVKNPIKLARYIMEKTEHVMFSSKGAEKIAIEAGLETVSPSYFYSEEKLQRAKNKIKTNSKKGTVGVVALDAYGNILQQELQLGV